MMKEVGTSESIINQKEFLTKYVAKESNWLLIDIYIDDGYKSEYLMKENAHEPIIDKQTFALVQDILERKAKYQIK